MNKVYSGWVLEISGQEYVVCGSNRLRTKTYYYLRSDRGIKSIGREELLEGMSNKTIKYITSVVVK